MDEARPELNPRKIRAGLAMVTIVVVAAIILIFLIEAPLGKAVMFAVALSGIVRAYLLSRSLRTER